MTSPIRTFGRPKADSTPVEVCPFIGGPYDRMVRGLEPDVQVVELTRDDGHGSATTWRYERDKTGPRMAFALKSTRRTPGRIVVPGDDGMKETVDVQ